MKRTCTIRVPNDKRVLPLQTAPEWTSVAPVEKSSGHWSNRLVTMKQQLDVEPYHSQWPNFKEYTNKYERVFTSSAYGTNKSRVACYVPVSRSYFKLWEILCDFGLIDEASLHQPIQTAHLAEGPGGFVEAMCNYRRSHNVDNTCNDDVYFGMTLIDEHNADVPDWSKAHKLMTTFPQIKLHRGRDDTGDLYKVENIHALVEDAGKQSCDLVTGDGGIDYSHDYAKQEELSQRLLVAQVYAGLLLVKPTKHFVCKLFDTNARFTQEVLWLLSVVFDVVHLVKPLTSRVANSERYVVACGYRGCAQEVEKYVRDLLHQWHPKQHIHSILKTSLPPVFIQALYRYNEWHSSQQCKSLHKCYRLIDDFLKQKSLKHNKRSTADKHRNKFDKHINRPCNSDVYFVLTDIKKQQESFARLWCTKYGVEFH